MSILMIIFILVLIGLGLYLLSFVPIHETIKKIIYIVAILITILWLLDVFGIFHQTLIKWNS